MTNDKITHNVNSLSKAKQSKAKLLLYILTNNYFKFLFQKIFFALRACVVNLVKSFLTLIKFTQGVKNEWR